MSHISLHFALDGVEHPSLFVICGVLDGDVDAWPDLLTLIEIEFLIEPGVLECRIFFRRERVFDIQLFGWRRWWWRWWRIGVFVG
jgi:hypothetical protein